MMEKTIISVVCEIQAVQEANRREAVRKRLGGTGALTVHARTIAVQLQDVNVTGICVMAPMTVPANVVCGIDLSIPGREGLRHALSLSARVAYCVLSGSHGFRLGMEFVGLSTEARAAIDQYMRGETKAAAR